jgi:hypothetical protein
MNPETLSAKFAQLRTSPSDSQWEHLEAQFARLDILLQREICRWELAGQDSHDEYRGMYLSPGEANRLLERPLATSWGQSVELAPEVEARFCQNLATATQRVHELGEKLQSQGVRPYLTQIADVFHLDPCAQDILLLTLAPAFDSRYEQIFGFLQDNVRLKRPSIRLALSLFGAPGLSRYTLAKYFGADEPLCKYGLIELITEAPPANEHWIHQTLHISDTVVAWVMGYYRPSTHLQDHIQLLSVPVCESEHEFAREKANRLLHLFDHSYDPLHDPLPDKAMTPQASTKVPLIAMFGVDQICQQSTAALLAAHAKRPLLTIALDKVVSEDFPIRRAIRHILRDALLTGSFLLLTGWQVCLDSDLIAEPAILQELCAHPGIIFLSSLPRWQARLVVRERSIWWEEFALPTSAERLSRWLLFLHQCREAEGALTSNPLGKISVTLKDKTIDEQELAQLTGRFILTTDQIRDAVTAARDRAWHAQRDLNVEDLYSSARAYSNPRLATLARKVTSRHAWDDLILPADQLGILHELIKTIQNRVKVLEQWGVGQKLTSSNGVTALFTGPSGTGKTLAAALAASVLELDLYKIDLSSLVSKYIGETEKNLERIFSEAATSNAVLFFDEADAIFGKRSEVKDAHDRYANIEVSYLLQRIESFDGVIILATNLRANLDEAFARRLQFSIDFPFPQAADRLRIWKTLFPAELPRSPDLDLALMAERFELTGGNIRNIIVTAAYLAATDGNCVTTKHLLHGTRRELQKIGRLVGEADFAIA